MPTKTMSRSVLMHFPRFVRLCDRETTGKGPTVGDYRLLLLPAYRRVKKDIFSARQIRKVNRTGGDLLEVHAAQQVCEARVWAQRIPYGIYFDRFSPSQ